MAFLRSWRGCASLVFSLCCTAECQCLWRGAVHACGTPVFTSGALAFVAAAQAMTPIA